MSVSGACLPAVSVTMSIVLYMAREHTSYVLSATVHVLHCSILSTRIGVDLQVGARGISSDILGGACIRLLIVADFLSNIWAVSLPSHAMRKAVPRNHRRAPSQMQPHPAPDLPPILGLSPSVRVSQARGPNAVQSPDHGYLHFPSNISYCSQLFPVWGCPGMRCLCVGRQSRRPMEAVI